MGGGLGLAEKTVKRPMTAILAKHDVGGWVEANTPRLANDG